LDVERAADRLSDGLVLLLFLAVPLAAAPQFWDQFTTVKWYVLEVLAVLFFLCELIGRRGGGWPVFVRQRSLLVLGLAGLILVNLLRGGIAAAAAPLLERATFVMLALSFFWYALRTGGRTACLTAGTALATAAVDAVGLAQVFGLQPLPGLTAGARQSSLLGNVNMTAQFLGFAIVILLTAAPRGFSRRRTIALEAVRLLLVASSLVYLVFLSSRSVALALFCATVALLAARRVPLLAGLGLAFAAGIVVFLVQLGPARSVAHELTGHKAASLELRRTAWTGTLELIHDHPLGVGTANFADAFIPYRVRAGSAPEESVVFLHPHNEYLRVLAEEGVLVFALGGLLLFLLCRELRRRGAPSWLLPMAVFLAVESFFQFPLALATGVLMAAALAGYALAAVETGAAPDERRATRWKVAGLTLSLLALVEVYRVARSEYLFVNCPDQLTCQERACRLNPRNRPACVLSAWFHAQTGDSRGARERLLQVLEGAPHDLPAIKLLGEEALVRGDRETGCLCLWIYDGLLRQQSSVHDRLMRTCPAVLRESFENRVSMPHYRKFPLGREAVPGN
jgi:hypothetical protein